MHAGLIDSGLQCPRGVRPVECCRRL